MARRVQAGNQPLRGSFFITGGAVNLSGQKKPRHGLGFEAWMQRAWVNIVIFNSIAVPENAHLLQPRNGADKCVLHIRRQRCRNAIGIDGDIVEALRLQKNLMAHAVGEARDLVFNRRAIARAYAAYLAGINRRFLDILGDNGEGFRRCAGNMANSLRRFDFLRQKRKRHRIGIRRLGLQHICVDGGAVEPRRCAGFQTPHAKIRPPLGQRIKPPRQSLRRFFAVPAGRNALRADMNNPVQKCAGGQNHRARRKAHAVCRHDG